jgi:hypothetical protein
LKKDGFCLFRFETPEIISNTKTDEAKQAERNENEPKYHENVGDIFEFPRCLELTGRQRPGINVAEPEPQGAV